MSIPTPFVSLTFQEVKPTFQKPKPFKAFPTICFSLKGREDYCFLNREYDPHYIDFKDVIAKRESICRNCGGTGQLYDYDDPFYKEECLMCLGTGVVDI